MFTKFTKIAVVSFLSITLGSCSLLQRKKEPLKTTQSVSAEFNSIRQDVKRNRITIAIKRLNALIAKHSNVDITDDAYILLGKIYYGQKKYDASFKAYVSVVDSQYYSPEEAVAIAGAASSLDKLGRYDEAASLLERGMRLKNIEKSTLVRLHKMRYRVLSKVGDRLDALRSLMFLVNNEKEPRLLENYKSKAMDFIESRLSEKELESITEKSEFGFVRGYACYSIAKVYFEQKDFSKAKSLFDDVIELLPGSDEAISSANYIEQISARRKVNPKVIGAILPLSGKHSKYAYKALHGIQLGLGIGSEDSSYFKLAVIDSEGNPDVARRAVERLVIENNVIAIIGSLLSRTSMAVATKANELGVPVIGLSQKSGLTDVGDSVFKNAITSSSQVRRLVQTAMDEQGLKKFAILYPNDPYGVEYANLFWDEVLARGGEIVGAQTYSPTETDFNGAIKRLTGTFYLEDRKAELTQKLRDWYGKQKVISPRISPPSDILPPIVDFDALFIPDSVKAIGQIAPMLAYNDISKLKLLGTNLWNNPGLITRGKNLVDGALFVDTPIYNGDNFKKTTFYYNYRKEYGEDPGIFEALAYDAALMIRQAVVRGETSRVGLRDYLANLNDFVGSIGRVYINQNREVVRPMASLTVHNNQIVESHLAPKPPETPLTQ